VAELLETVECSHAEPAAASVVWLHGLGADGHDFEPIVPGLAVDGTPLRFVFPHAPVQPITINGGMAMRAWYDIISLERGTEQDEQGIRRAERQLHALIEREQERGIPAEKILLAGFSQGGAVALHTALRYPQRLAGVIGLSTFLPLDWTVEAEAHEANRETPIFLAHGTLDPLVVPSLGEGSCKLLTELGYDVEWRTYPMPHAVCPEEVTDLRDWMARRLPG
jgi:phospholipase/carboxylesterase